MSCGKPHETDCAEVLAEVWLFLDHECDAARRKLLERHLDECTPCLAEYGLDEKLKKLLATKCSGEHAPDGLKNRLRQSIRQIVLESADVTVESGPGGHRGRGAHHPARADVLTQQVPRRVPARAHRVRCSAACRGSRRPSCGRGACVPDGTCFLLRRLHGGCPESRT